MTPEDVQHELDMHERHGHGSIRGDVDRLTSRVDELVGIVDDLRRALEEHGRPASGLQHAAYFRVEPGDELLGAEGRR